MDLDERPSFGFSRRTLVAIALCLVVPPILVEAMRLLGVLWF